MVSNLHTHAPPRLREPQRIHPFLWSYHLLNWHAIQVPHSFLEKLSGKGIYIAGLTLSPATFSLTPNNLSSTYSLSWWPLLVSHFQKSRDFFTQPHPTPPFGCILPLKLATFGFWANGCSQISFLHKDSLFLICIFSSTCARFTQEPSLNPFFIFTLLTPLNSAQVSIFHFYQDISTKIWAIWMAHLCSLLQTIAINCICKVLYCLETVVPPVFHLSSSALQTPLLSLCYSLKLNLAMLVANWSLSFPIFKIGVAQQ